MIFFFNLSLYLGERYNIFLLLSLYQTFSSETLAARIVSKTPSTCTNGLSGKNGSKNGFLVLDCRPFIAYNVSHIRGAINVNCCDRKVFCHPFQDFLINLALKWEHSRFDALLVSCEVNKWKNDISTILFIKYEIRMFIFCVIDYWHHISLYKFISRMHVIFGFPIESFMIVYPLGKKAIY